MVCLKEFYDTYLFKSLERLLCGIQDEMQSLVVIFTASIFKKSKIKNKLPNQV